MNTCIPKDLSTVGSWQEFFERSCSERVKTAIRRLYGKKAALMREGLLAATAAVADRVTFTDPEGGLFMWATLPEGFDVPEFAKKLLEKKVAIVPGVAFAADPAVPVAAFRLNYSTPSDEQIIKGTALLGEALTLELK